MAMSINVGYFARESIQNFRRNWVMSLGAVITIYLSLLLVGIFIATGFVVNSVVQSVEDKVTIQVFIKDGAASADVNSLQTQLLDDALVDGVDYTTKEEALEQFKKDMAAVTRDHRSARGQSAAGLARRDAEGSADRRADGRQDQEERALPQGGRSARQPRGVAQVRPADRRTSSSPSRG